MPRDFFIFLRQQFGNKKLCGVEVGVKRGENAETVLAYLDFKRFYLVDLWKAYTDVLTYGEVQQGYTAQSIMDIWYQETLKKFEGDDRILILKEESAQASRLFDSNFDFVYIDAKHTYDAVTNDCSVWYPKLLSTGFLGGHDYFNKGTQVKSAVDDFAKVINKKVNSKGEDWWLT